jgi:hypothetical protein
VPDVTRALGQRSLIVTGSLGTLVADETEKLGKIVEFSDAKPEIGLRTHFTLIGSMKGHAGWVRGRGSDPVGLRPDHLN